MISEFMMNIVFSILTGLLSLLPNISWDVNSGAVGTFMDVISCVTYMLPMGTVIAITSLVVSLMVFRIVIAIIKTIWDLLPVL